MKPRDTQSKQSTGVKKVGAASHWVNIKRMSKPIRIRRHQPKPSLIEERTKQTAALLKQL